MTEPDLSIKLNSDYYLGVFIKNTTLDKILREKLDIDIGADDEYTIEDQCVPYSLYLLASAISDKSSLYEGKSMAKLTGLGESKFSKDASQVIQDIFPSVDVMGNKCNTTFKFKNFYSVQYNTDYPDLSLGIIYDIIIPFLRRYPNKKNIGTTNNDYIIIPFGYNIIGLKTKVNYGHQLLMVININYLYKLKSIDFQVLTDNINNLVEFIDNLYEGLVTYDVWNSKLLLSFNLTVNKWLNPPRPVTELKKAPSWAPKQKLYNTEDIKLWEQQKNLANEDTYHLTIDTLISDNTQFALASNDIVGSIKKRPKKDKKKKQSKKKQPKKKQSKKKQPKKKQPKKKQSKKRQSKRRF